MKNLENIPYVKKYNDKGELLNPIIKSYQSRTVYQVPLIKDNKVVGV